MNFKDSVLSSSKFYGNHTDGHTFEGQYTARLGNLDTAIGYSSKDIVIMIMIVNSTFLQHKLDYKAGH